MKVIKERNFLSLFFFMFCSAFVWSQHTLSGEVKDQSNNPVAYANLLVLKAQDSSVVKGTSTDDYGAFKFEEITKGNYIIKTSFVGYKEHFISLTVSNSIDIDTIILEESVEALSEVEIVYKKPTLKREADRLVFNVESTSLSEGNMIDVLKSTPSVLIIDDDLMVKNSRPVVYINNRKVHLSSSELLQLLESTSASHIKSIEVITNPSAKYDADSGVVINIVMSKNLVTGYNGNVFTNYTQGVFSRLNFGTSHYFKSSKFDVFINYSYNDNKINRFSKETIFYPNEVWNTDINRNTWSETHTVGVNLDYKINSKNTISFAANTQFLPYFKYQTKSDATITGSSSPFIGFEALNLSRDNKHNIGFDLDYNYTINNNSSLSANAHYTNYDYSRDQKVNSKFNSAPGILFAKTAFNTLADQETNIFTSQLDYNLNVTESSTFSAGTKFSNINTDSGIFHFDIVGNTSIFNQDNSNTFDYNEKIYAAYVNYDYTTQAFSFQAGLRGEQTDLSSVSAQVDRNTQNYFEVFPSANLSYQFSKNINSYITYKRSIQRPNYSNLNPFKFYLNDNTAVVGNPQLQPIFISNILVGTTLFEKFTFEAYYKTYSNNIFELPIQDNSTNIIEYTPLNINKTTEIGFDFETYFDLTKRWFLYFGTSTYNYKDEGELFGTQVKRDKWANYSIVSNDFSFLKDNSLTANVSLIYVSANVQGLQLVDSRLLSDVSIKKSILKGKGVISLAISDVFNEQDFFVTTRFLDQNSTLYTNLDNRYVKFGFRYKFGNTKLSTNQRSTSKEERNRLN